MVRPEIGENGPKLAQNRTFSDFSQIWLITFPSFPEYSQRLIVASFCRKPHVQKKIWSRVTGPKRGKNGEIVPFFNRVYLGNEQSKSKSVLIFGKLEGSSFEKVRIRFLIFPLLHPENRGRKSGPIWDRKHGLLVISSLLHQISLIFCMQLEANSGFNSVKTACPGKIWFSQKLGKT